MTKHRTVLDYIDHLSDWSGKLTSFLILFMILATVVLVVLRYLLEISPPWDPVNTYSNLLAVYIILGAAYALRHNAHVNIDILYRHFSVRGRAVADLFTSILFFIFFIIILWQSLYHFPRIISEVPLSLNMLAPPNWPIRLIWPLGVLLLLLQGLSSFAHTLVTVITGEDSHE